MVIQLLPLSWLCLDLWTHWLRFHLLEIFLFSVNEMTDLLKNSTTSQSTSDAADVNDHLPRIQPYFGQSLLQTAKCNSVLKCPTLKPTPLQKYSFMKDLQWSTASQQLFTVAEYVLEDVRLPLHSVKHTECMCYESKKLYICDVFGEMQTAKCKFLLSVIYSYAPW